MYPNTSFSAQSTYMTRFSEITSCGQQGWPNEAGTTLRPRAEASLYRGPWMASPSNVFFLKENLVFLSQTLLTPDGKVWALLSGPGGQTTSECRHLYPPAQECSYGPPLTPAKRPKRKVAPKRRQERPVSPPKKRRRKLHRMDHYAAEARQDKVSLSTVPNLCGGQVCLWYLGLKIVWVRFRKTGALFLALSPGPSGPSGVNGDVKTSWTLLTTGGEKKEESFILFKVSWLHVDVAVYAGGTAWTTVVSAWKKRHSGLWYCLLRRF